MGTLVNDFATGVPHPRLRPYVSTYTGYRIEGAAPGVYMGLPSKSLTFIVAFAVMSSGISSASTASRAFAANLSNSFDLKLAGGIGITVIGLLLWTPVRLAYSREGADGADDAERAPHGA